MVMALSRMDQARLRTLPPRARTILIDEWEEPESRGTVLQILRSPDPTGTLARELSTIVRDEISEQVYLEALDVPPPLAAGQEGLFKSIKRVTSRVRKGVRRVVSKSPLGRVHLKIKDKISDARKRIHRKARKVVKNVGSKAYEGVKRHVRRHLKYFRRYAPIIAPIIGAILAPFTLGLSAVAGTLIATGAKMYDTRKRVKELEKKSQKEADAMAVIAADEAKELEVELDKFYEDAKAVFIANGITPEKWAAMDVDEKLKVMDEIASAPAQGDTEPGAGDDLPASTGGTQVDSGGTSVSEEGDEAPAATYVVFVNGRKVGEVGSLGEASELAAEHTGVGDRFQMNVNGRSTGLRIRTTGGGQMGVPKQYEAQVKGMTKDQVIAMLDKAKGKAKGVGFPTWLLIPVGAVAAYAAAS